MSNTQRRLDAALKDAFVGFPIRGFIVLPPEHGRHEVLIHMPGLPSCKACEVNTIVVSVRDSDIKTDQALKEAAQKIRAGAQKMYDAAMEHIHA